MNIVIKYYRSRSYNKSKKPWRNLKWAFNCGKGQSRLIYLLCGCLFFEAVIIFPHQKENICRELGRLYTVKEEFMEETITGISSMDEVEGEVRERGFLLDFKEGELKFWQKVEQKFLQKSD